MKDQTQSLPWWRLHTSHLTSEVLPLPVVARGIILSLMPVLWSKGTIPADQRAVARYAFSSVAEVSTVWDDLMGYYAVDEDGNLCDPYLEGVRSEMDEKRVKRQLAGRAGGQASASKRQANVKQTLGFTQANVGEIPSIACENPSEKRREEKRRETPLLCSPTEAIVEQSSSNASHAKRFTKPTVDEVWHYMQERKHFAPRDEAQYFWDWHQSKGWVIGKAPMKDWKAAVRYWLSRPRRQSSLPTMSTDPLAVSREASRIIAERNRQL